MLYKWEHIFTHSIQINCIFFISFQCGTNIRIFKYICIYLDKYIHLSKYSFIFFQRDFIRIFICDLFILTNIFEYSFVQYLLKRIYLNFHCFPKMLLNSYYWSETFQYGSTITQNMKMAKVVLVQMFCKNKL